MLAEVQCALCGKQFQSNPQAFLCKGCQNQNQYPDAIVELRSNHSLDIMCPICTYKNSSNSIQCDICQHIFQQKLQKISPKKPEIKQLITCKRCKFENHIMNECCLNCEEDLFEHVKKTCSICGLNVKQDNFNKHEEDCKMSLSLIEMEETDRILKEEARHFKGQDKYSGLRLRPHIIPMKQPISRPSRASLFGGVAGLLGLDKEPATLSCYYCYQKIQREQYNSHVQKCEKKDQWQRNMSPQNSRMTPLQVKTIQHMHGRSRNQHEGVRRQLENRVHKLGFSKEDLENLSYYIENYAPIIIQIHVSRHMKFFVKDTHYRSQFQTNQSSGSLSRASRTQWEDRMFDKHYSKAKDFQRVKYGVINFTNDPKGVNCAKSYGPSYFLLKTHVRNRCTFTDKDSSSSDAIIATLKFPFRIISKMNDAELKAAFSASKALEMSSAVIITYKEIQIHGPIEFSKDIERVYVSKTQINGNKQLLDLVYEFSQKFKVQHDFI